MLVAAEHESILGRLTSLRTTLNYAATSPEHAREINRRAITVLLLRVTILVAGEAALYILGLLKDNAGPKPVVGFLLAAGALLWMFDFAAFLADLRKPIPR